MNAKKVLGILGELRVLRFFPGDEIAMVALMRLCDAMCHNEDEVRWLVDRMTSGIYSEWPGISEMRACFCNRFKPKDGINAYSSVYPDGLPPDPTAPPRREIAAAELKALPPGRQVSADARLDRSIAMLADVKDMNRVRRPSQTPPLPPEKRITQMDIDREVAKLQEAKRRDAEAAAREELV